MREIFYFWEPKNTLSLILIILLLISGCGEKSPIFAPIKKEEFTWIYQNPIPPVLDPYDICSDNAGGLFVASTYGAMLHYDGTNWDYSPITHEWPFGGVHHIYATSPNDVWAFADPYIIALQCGRNDLYHYNGLCWQSFVKSGDIYALWASGPDDVVIVKEGDPFWSSFHFDGTFWNKHNISECEHWPCRCRRIWGVSSDNLFVIFCDKDTCKIFHFDGSNWILQYEGSHGLSNIWGTCESNVFAVGEGIILHYDGRMWSEQEVPVTSGLADIWGSSSHDIFAVGSAGTILHYDGYNWSSQESGTNENLWQVWGTGSNNVFARGNNIILHFDGSSWVKYELGSDIGLRGICGTNSNDIFAVGSRRVNPYESVGEIFEYDGASWHSIVQGTRKILYAVWGCSESQVIAAGESGIFMEYDGNSWEEYNSGINEDFIRMWGSSYDDIFAVTTSGNLMHFDGSSWEMEDIAQQGKVNGVWGLSSDNVYVVCDSGKVCHYVDGSWSEIQTPTENDLWGIWGSSKDTLFVVGNYGTILCYDGSSWINMSTDTYYPLIDVCGTSSDNVYAVSALKFLHYDGNSWKPITEIEDKYREYLHKIYLDIWINNKNDIFLLVDGYIVNRGIIFHYDGFTWSLEPIISHRLFNLWGDGTGVVYAVGDKGTILKRVKMER